MSLFSKSGPGEAGSITVKHSSSSDELGDLAVESTSYTAANETSSPEVSQDADSLTLDRRHVEKEFQRRASSGDSFALLLVGPDNFKAVNDRWGHHTGDEVLFFLSGLLRSISGPRDCVNRWLGDQFLVILDLTISPEHTVNDLRGKLHSGVVAYVEGQPIRLTASTGYVPFTPGNNWSDVNRSLEAGMYDAKLLRRAMAPLGYTRSDIQ